MDPAFRFDGVQKNRVEYWNILFPRFDPGVKGEASQGIHDLGDIDIVWASNTTSIAGSTDPDRLRSENLFSMPVLNMTEHLIGEDIHRISDGTSRRTFLALKTGLDFFPAGLNDFKQERILLLVSLYV